MFFCSCTSISLIISLSFFLPNLCLSFSSFYHQCLTSAVAPSTPDRKTCRWKHAPVIRDAYSTRAPRPGWRQHSRLWSCSYSVSSMCDVLRLVVPAFGGRSRRRTLDNQEHVATGQMTPSFRRVRISFQKSTGFYQIFNTNIRLALNLCFWSSFEKFEQFWK